MALCTRCHATGSLPRLWQSRPVSSQGNMYIKRNVDKLKECFRVSEHPFGTVKFYDGAYFFLCKGKGKVAAKTSLMFTSYNIRRAISLAGGVQNLIGRIMAAKCD